MTFEQNMAKVLTEMELFTATVGANATAIEVMADLIDALDAAQRESVRKSLPAFQAMVQEQRRYITAVERLELELVYAGDDPVT
jgi:hypothetical protein